MALSAYAERVVNAAFVPRELALLDLSISNSLTPNASHQIYLIIANTTVNTPVLYPL